MYKVYVWPDLSWIGEDDHRDLEFKTNESDDFAIVEVPDDIEDIDAWLLERERAFWRENILFPDTRDDGEPLRETNEPF